jgi:hypothetical protein
MPALIQRDGSSVFFEGPDFPKTEFTKRRRDEKNSAQPCFPVLVILPSPFIQESYKGRKQASVSF